MSIEASLVVLSGCGTAIEGGLARGDAPGDELAGLYRAFLAAGAGTVIAGSWELDDLAARSFMPRLYTMLDGRTPAEALAALQRDLISGRITDASGRPLDHPFYWAGLAAYGAGKGAPAVIARAAAREEIAIRPAP
jgi:CHAT domain-containing protein